MAHSDGDKHIGAALEAASAERLLDPAALQELISLDPDGSAGFLAQIVETFIKSTEQLLLNTKWENATLDPKSIGKAAHSLKSSAGTVGARRLSAMCGNLEAGIREGDAADLEQRFAQIRSVYLETREALIAELQGGNS